ncbi:RNA polymerase sigma factor [Streptacidiphilus melanogenes]|uniref:RNA polymerase sigma factor n=1 Tax=Streptacidiphilus melanogenes TaxID=411235 RepID=UPI0005AB91C4|nr:sigma-70 family RNA polymerase sigma factor [Streptacidiphilus melanogenes]
MKEVFFSTGPGPDAWTDPDQPPWLAQPAELPIGFELFVLAHLDAWHEYAAFMLGCPDRASRVCHDVLLYIAAWWHDFEDDPAVGRNAWEVLQAGVTYEKRRPDGSPSFMWKMAFGHAMVSARHELAAEEGPVLRAVAQLPPRQFDVIILKHFMDRSREEIAWLLGRTISTVDRHHREATAALKESLTKGRRKGESV